MSNSSKDDKREFLVKYAYVKGTFATNALRYHIRQCPNDALIDFFYLFFKSYIMPYFKDYSMRTQFNKIRSGYMQMLLSAMSLRTISVDTYLSFYEQYNVIAAFSGILSNPVSREVYDMLLPKIVDEKEAFKQSLNNQKIIQ